MTRDVMLDSILKSIIANNGYRLVNDLIPFFPHTQESKIEEAINYLEDKGYITCERYGLLGHHELIIKTEGEIFYEQGGFQQKTETANQQAQKLQYELQNAKHSKKISIIAVVISILSLAVSAYSIIFK